MKVFIFLVALTAVRPVHLHRDGTFFLNKQQKVLQLLTALGSDVDPETDKRQGFKFTDPELYTNPVVAEKFNDVYNRGLLPRNGVFSLTFDKNKQDTFKLIDVFMEVKSIDMFFKIAEWAKSELNPLQFSFAFIVAINHRKETKDLIVPPLYEILPHYFVTSDIMMQIYRSKLNGHDNGKYVANTTCWEWSWYREMTSGPFLFGQKWNGEDPESALSYFREDVHLSDWYAKFMMIYTDHLDKNNKNKRLSELYYKTHIWLLRRFNLERYAVRLRPVSPLPYNGEIKFGYNPRMMDMFGRPFLGRVDAQVPMETNGLDFKKVKLMERRLTDSIDIGYLTGRVNESNAVIDGKNGLNNLVSSIFELNDAVNKKYYGHWFSAAVKATNDIVLFSNDREMTTTVVGEYMTALRDPIFYMIISKLDTLLNTHLLKLPSYTKEQLNFPGVKITGLQVGRLSTRFEMYDFDVTNGVPLAGNSSYTVSQFRINHEPFTLELKVHAESPSVALIKVFVGPKLDLEHRPLLLTQSWYGFTLLDYFSHNLVSGDNVIERSSENNEMFENPVHFKELYEEVNKSISSKKPLNTNKFTGCGLPGNLMLPLGSPSGRDYQMFVILYPLVQWDEYDKGKVCGLNMMTDQNPPNYPFDRWPDETQFETDNMIFKHVTIYHKDLDRGEQQL